MEALVNMLHKELIEKMGPDQMACHHLAIAACVLSFLIDPSS